jgi:hypothetical protein
LLARRYACRVEELYTREHHAKKCRHKKHRKKHRKKYRKKYRDKSAEINHRDKDTVR